MELNMNIAGEILTFKMNSGEELVAKVIRIEKNSSGGLFYTDTFVISNPVAIGPGPGGGLGLVPSMFTYKPDSEVRLNSNSISVIAETDDGVKSKYIQATTGIRLPDKKIVLG